MTSSQSARDVTTLTASRELFSMELFRDPSFLRSIAIQEYPFVAFERETLYVQTNLSAGKYCFI